MKFTQICIYIYNSFTLVFNSPILWSPKKVTNHHGFLVELIKKNHLIPSGWTYGTWWSLHQPTVVSFEPSSDWFAGKHLPTPRKKRPATAGKTFPQKHVFFCESAGNVRTTVAGDTFSKKNTRTWRDRTKKVRAHPTIRFTCRTLRFAKSHCMDGKNFSLKFAEGLGGENFKLSSQHPIIIATSVVSVENYGICLICLCCPWGCNGIHWT